jgi:hypothetical protein
MIRILESSGLEPQEVDLPGENPDLRAGLFVGEEQRILGQSGGP